MQCNLLLGVIYGFLFLILGCSGGMKEVIVGNRVLGGFKEVGLGNILEVGGMRMKIPVDWDYIYEGGENRKIIFEDGDMSVRGEVNIYSYGGELGEDLVGEYMQEVGQGIELEWWAKEWGWGKKMYIMKGIRKFDRDILYGVEGVNEVYLSLIEGEGKIYEVIFLGQEEGLEGFVLSILKGLRINNGGVGNVERVERVIRHGLRVEYVEGWEWGTARGRNIVDWEHKREGLGLRIRYLGVMEEVEGGGMEGWERSLELLKIHLKDIKYRYNFDIKGEELGGREYKVFEGIGLLGKSRELLGIRVYYFSEGRKLYGIIIWYQGKGWGRELQGVVGEVLGSIYRHS